MVHKSIKERWRLNMKQYLDFCRHIIENGVEKKDRTGTGTISTFGYQMRFDLQKGFPLMTTKELNHHLITTELEWFVKGMTNIKFLLERKNNIWNEWGIKRWFESEDYHGPDMTNFGIRKATDPEFEKVYRQQLKIYKEKVLTEPEFAEKYGHLGAVYGKQWRSWEGANGKTYDQLQWVIDEIKRNPDSRRLIVSAWNPQYAIPATDGTIDPDIQALPPCHSLFQFYVQNERLSLQLYQRSGDTLLGIPFNIASYSLLVHLVAQVTGLEVGEFIHTIGDAHIYSNHLEQIELQLTRDPYELPTLKLNPEIKRIEDFTAEDVEFVNYKAHPHIKGAVAV